MQVTVEENEAGEFKVGDVVKGEAGSIVIVTRISTLTFDGLKVAKRGLLLFSNYQLSKFSLFRGKLTIEQ